MQDVLGWKKKFGVITPSTNTVVQPEYDDLRPIGVTNHISRMHIPDNAIKDDDDFEKLIFDIEPEKKKRLLEGLDNIDLSLKKIPNIEKFENSMKKNKPWI